MQVGNGQIDIIRNYLSFELFYWYCLVMSRHLLYVCLFLLIDNWMKDTENQNLLATRTACLISIILLSLQILSLVVLA